MVVIVARRPRVCPTGCLRQAVSLRSAILLDDAFQRAVRHMAVASSEQQQRGENAGEAAIAILKGMASPIQSIWVQLHPIWAVYG